MLRLAKQALETARADELIFPAESVTVEEMGQWLDQRIDADFRGGYGCGSISPNNPLLIGRRHYFLAVLERRKAGITGMIECFGPIKKSS